MKFAKSLEIPHGDDFAMAMYFMVVFVLFFFTHPESNFYPYRVPGGIPARPGAATTCGVRTTTRGCHSLYTSAFTECSPRVDRARCELSADTQIFSQLVRIAEIWEKP